MRVNFKVHDTHTHSQNHSGFAARHAALDIIADVFDKKLNFDMVFDRKATSLDPRDRAFCRQLCLLTLRRRGNLEVLLRKMLRKPLGTRHRRIYYVLMLGLSQILFLETKAHAAVDLSVELVKSSGGHHAHLAGLVNAVLRRAAQDAKKLKRAANKNPLNDVPEWLAARWIENWGKPTSIKMARTLQFIPDSDITLKDPATLDKWLECLTARKLPCGSLRLEAGDITALEGFKSGDWWVQDAAAALPAKLLGVKSGERVLDMCAAPGGKTLQLASSGAQVTAIDRSEKRLVRLQENLKRTDLTADICVADAASYSPDETADHVLLDAPCSATGTFRRNPDGLWSKSAEDIQRLSQLQAKLLGQAAGLVKIGGRLVYCVCSLEKEEGEAQWQAFLDQHTEFKRLPVQASEVGGDDSFLAEMITPEGDLRTLPLSGAEKLTIDGFFIGRATRVS